MIRKNEIVYNISFLLKADATLPHGDISVIGFLLFLIIICEILSFAEVIFTEVTVMTR